jgi:hypothetical protein
MPKHSDPFSYKARELRETASRMEAEASKYEALSRGLKKASKGDFLVLETADNVGMPVQMGTYEGISFRDLDPVVQLGNPAYLIKDLKTGRYSLCNDRTEQLFFSIVVDSMIRNIKGKSTVPTVHKETEKNKREKTAEEILQEYGCSIEQYRQLFAAIPQTNITA